MEWFYERNAEIWKKEHEGEILDALRDQAELKRIKDRYVEHRGCDANCDGCETVDWCPFTVEEGPE